MRNDPMCWQLSLADGDKDTAKNRNKRLTGSPEVRTIRWKSNGSGVVHTPYKMPRRKMLALQLNRVADDLARSAAVPAPSSRLLTQRV